MYDSLDCLQSVISAFDDSLHDASAMVIKVLGDAPRLGLIAVANRGDGNGKSSPLFLIGLVQLAAGLHQEVDGLLQAALDGDHEGRALGPVAVDRRA